MFLCLFIFLLSLNRRRIYKFIRQRTYNIFAQTTLFLPFYKNRFKSIIVKLISHLKHIIQFCTWVYYFVLFKTDYNESYVLKEEKTTKKL